MKKFILPFFLFIANVSWALVLMSHSITGGVVKSVSWVDQVKGTKSEIIVKDTAGKTFNILVTSTTTLWDADAKAIVLDKGIVKKKVNVTYITTEEGINVGESIKVLQ